MNKKNILLSWIGDYDLRDPLKKLGELYGAITSILTWSKITFQEVHLLSNRKNEQTKNFETWLGQHLMQSNRKVVIQIHYDTDNENPTDYKFIYQAADKLIKKLDYENNQLYLNMTSGTPAMSATWLLLGTGVYDAILMQSSKERGVERIELPYHISLKEKYDRKLIRLHSQILQTDPHFELIPAKSEAMKLAVSLAQLVAPCNVPLIIQGQTGTGKEVLANAIHKASTRSSKPLIAVNCGAIPESLIDAELFGHTSGAFTGADRERKGYFEAANGGTLFLDELGELSLSAQVKLLRVLQQNEIVRVGSTKPIPIDVRVIAATHRDLLKMIDDGLFREDLFYRLAIGLIHLPRLNECKEDVLPLAEMLLEETNRDLKNSPNFISKKFSRVAQQFLQQQTWPGNIRELKNTIIRAAVWNPNIAEITDKHLQQAMIQRRDPVADAAINNTILNGPVNLCQIIKQTKMAYIQAALNYHDGNKSSAAKMLGLNNSQTLDNWLKN